MTEEPTRQLTTASADKPAKVDRRTQLSQQMKAALDSMVEEGLQFDEAAVKQNLTVRAMRLALKRPNVIKYLREARHVFLAHVGASNIRRLRDLRDQDENRAAAVAAARTIEGLVEHTVGSPHSVAGPRAGYMIDLSDEPRAGLVIIVNHNRPAPSASDDAIDITPNHRDE